MAEKLMLQLFEVCDIQLLVFCLTSPAKVG